jgi:hypothetical protein
LVFALSALVWYLLFVQLLEAVDFPVSLPVGDLSGVVPGKSVRVSRRRNTAARAEES